MQKAYNHILLVVLLAALTSVTPLAIDTYLPSMPEIARYLHVGIEKIEMTISIFLLFFALGQLIGGILSDRIGRRMTALIGLGFFTAADFALYTTSTLEELYFFRALQALSGGLAIVNSSAIVRDLFHGKEAAKVFSTIASITMIAPMIAPALGALVISYSPNILAVFLAMTIYVGILGIIFGNGIALALEFFKNDSGVANSVIGVSEFTIAGSIGFIASSIHTGTLIPIFAMMAATSLLALLSLKFVRG